MHMDDRLQRIDLISGVAISRGSNAYTINIYLPRGCPTISRPSFAKLINSNPTPTQTQHPTLTQISLGFDLGGLYLLLVYAYKHRYIKTQVLSLHNKAIHLCSYDNVICSWLTLMVLYRSTNSNEFTLLTSLIITFTHTIYMVSYKEKKKKH